MATSRLSKKTILFIVLIFSILVIFLFVFGNLSKKNIVEINSVKENPKDTSISVPLSTNEDIVRTFCNLINEGRISEAVGMMDVQDESTKQSWGVTFNNFSSFKLIDIQKSKIDETGDSFEVKIDVSLKENLTQLPIPNYGWVEGENIKWINLIKINSGEYKISEIATGP